MKWFCGAGCLTSSKPFDFGVFLGHDPDLGIFNGIFTILGHDYICKNFGGSAALAEISCFRVLLVNFYNRG